MPKDNNPVLTIGPFSGVADVQNLSGQDGSRAFALTNCYAPQAVVGGDIISRPGMTRLGLGAAVSRTGTVSVTATLRALNGTGTAFLTELAAGDLVTVSGQTRLIESVTNDTAAVVSTAWGSTVGPVSYTYTPAGIEGGPIYGVYQYQNTDGTTRRYIIAKTTNTLIDGVGSGAGSGFYRFLDAGSNRIRLVEYDPSNAVHPLTDRTSTTMNGVALYTDKRIYGLTFANYFILSDGTNRPRKISSAWVLSNLTDGNYAVTGSPTVYYGKLFIVDGSDAITIRWSEENDPDTGYGTGTSDNSWALRQTSADQLTGLIGTNDALYCFRQNSIAIISGAANSDFRSSGTVDAIQNIGCQSPDAAALINNSVVFFDQYARPGRIAPGYGYIPLYKRVQETIRGAANTAAQLRAAWLRFDPTTNLLKFAYRTANGSTTNDQMIVFEPDQWESLGTHIWYSSGSTAMDHAYSCIWLDENGKPRHVVASGTTGDLAVYIQKTEDTLSSSAKDTLAAGDQTVAVTIETPKMVGDPFKQKLFKRVAVGTRNVGGTTAGITLWKVQYKTPNTTAYTTAASMLMEGQTSVPSSWTLDGAAFKEDFQGIDAQGRWIQFKFTNDTTGNPATRATLDTVTAFVTEQDGDYTNA